MKFLVRLFAVAVVSMLALSCAPSVPFAALKPWPGYPLINSSPTSHKRVLVIKCEMSDTVGQRPLPTNVSGKFPNLDSYFTSFYGLANGTGNVLDYLRDVTYGGMLVQTEGTNRWVTASYASNNIPSRHDRIEKCANAIPAAEVDFSRYDSLLVLTNAVQDSGACATGPTDFTIGGTKYSLGCAIIDPNGTFTGFAAHELLHTFGLNHSWANFPPTSCALPTGEYCDQTDMMSALKVKGFIWPNYPSPFDPGTYPGVGAGPGLNLPNLLTLNAVPQNRLLTYTVGSNLDPAPQPEAVCLTALSHPTSDCRIGVTIDNNRNAPDTGVSTVEFRTSDGWDRGLSSTTDTVSCVLIHEYGKANAPSSVLIRRSGADSLGCRQQGDVFSDPSGSFTVTVVAIDNTQHTATILVTPISKG